MSMLIRNYLIDANKSDGDSNNDLTILMRHIDSQSNSILGRDLNFHNILLLDVNRSEGILKQICFRTRPVIEHSRSNDDSNFDYRNNPLININKSDDDCNTDLDSNMKPVFCHSSSSHDKSFDFHYNPVIGTNKPNGYSNTVQVIHQNTFSGHFSA